MSKDKNGVEITPTPELNEDGTPKLPVEVPEDQQDAEFEKQLKELETEDEPVPPTKTELEKAEFTAKSVLKRIKDLGGDTSKLLGEVEPTAEKLPVDTTQFVTKADLAQTEAARLAKTPSELKLIMWWVKNKGMSVADAHYMANKGRITKLVGEVTRTRETVPSPGGGAGQRGTDKVDVPELSKEDVTRLTQAGMVWKADKKAFVGKKVQQRFDEATKQWVVERI